MSETRRPPEPYETFFLDFKEPPHIASRDDALYLLDRMIYANHIENLKAALEALREAIETELI